MYNKLILLAFLFLTALSAIAPLAALKLDTAALVSDVGAAAKLAAGGNDLVCCPACRNT